MVIPDTPQDSICRGARKTTKQQNIVPLNMDDTTEWYHYFVMVPKVNGKARLCLKRV